MSKIRVHAPCKEELPSGSVYCRKCKTYSYGSDTVWVERDVLVWMQDGAGPTCRRFIKLVPESEAVGKERVVI